MVGRKRPKARAGQSRSTIDVAPHGHASPTHLCCGVHIGLGPRSAGAGARVGHLVRQFGEAATQAGDIALVEERGNDPAQFTDPFDLVGTLASLICHFVYIAGAVHLPLVVVELHFATE